MAPVACRSVIKCGKSGCAGSCPLSVEESEYTDGKKPATCRTCGKTPRKARPPHKSMRCAKTSKCQPVDHIVERLTQGAGFLRSGEKRLPFWQKTPDTGTKTLVQSLPPFVRCWRRARSREPDASATLDGTVSADHRPFLQGYGNANMEKGAWAFAQFGHGERYHHRFCQESQVSLDQRGKFHGCTCAGLSCLRSHQRPSTACGWIHSQPNFLCSLPPENLGHQEA